MIITEVIFTVHTHAPAKLRGYCCGTKALTPRTRCEIMRTYEPEYFAHIRIAHSNDFIMSNAGQRQ